MAYGLFLWMFLSVAWIDAIGDTWVNAGLGEEGERTLTFAADWRHGMNGHSPIYLPGFFALTIASWYWVEKQSPFRLIGGGLLALLAGFALAWETAPIGREAASLAFISEFGITSNRLPPASLTVVGVSAYTAVCWTAFVLACRKGIATGSIRLFAMVASLYVILGFIRNWWSFGHFEKGNDVSRWATRVSEGDSVAIFSVLALVALAVFLVGTERLNRSAGSQD